VPEPSGSGGRRRASKSQRGARATSGRVIKHVHQPDSLTYRAGTGTAGAVLAIEASRLARNGRDWHTLL
jgi:hypothetical protein